MLQPLFEGPGRLKETYASLRGRTGAQDLMPILLRRGHAGTRSQRCKGSKKTLPEATHKASELHGEAIKPELGLWH
jgi:hypothetical protein